MPRKSAVTPLQRDLIRYGLERSDTTSAIAKATGLSRTTVARLKKSGVERVRTADEFKGIQPATARRHDLGRVAWSLERIIKAREDQMLGLFHEPVALARAMRTDDALFVAYTNRIAPQSAIATRLKPCDTTARGASAARKAARSVIVAGSVLKNIQGSLANHAVAIGYIVQTPSDDGTRVDFRLTEWPLEHVRWNNSEEQLQTTTREGARLNIVHGDGQWVIFRKLHELPWTQEACVLPGAALWAMHANAGQDWAGASRSHGQPKLVGEMPAGVSLQKIDPTSGMLVLTPEALGFLDMLAGLVSGDMGAGIRPAGAKSVLLTNGSTAWQVFSELRNSTEKIAARIYLGTDAILGSVGGAPGVDIAQLFGVASTILQGDFNAIEEGLNTGVYQPWTAINLGDSTYSPRFEYLLPDVDAAAKSEEQSKKRTRLFDALDRMRTLNLDVTQADVDKLAAELGVSDPPRLGATAAKQLQLPDSALTATITGQQAREAQGLAPFGDERDAMTLDEIAIYAKGRADAEVARIKTQAAIALAPAPGAVDGAAPADPLAGAVKLELAPTDVARIVRVREARASQGLPPFGDERDDMTLPEMEAAAQAKADIQVKTAPDPNAAAPAVPPPLPNA